MSNYTKPELNQTLHGIQLEMDGLRIKAILLSGELYSTERTVSPRGTPDFFSQATGSENNSRGSQSPMDLANRRLSPLSAEISRFIADDNASLREGEQLLEKSLSAIEEIKQLIRELDRLLPHSGSAISLSAIVLNNC
ncbi:MAG: hypothetical protein COV52_05055 [Gammaproteobacteria bacterium CG11_big_fil_rev_8_21_14_0_20_46_22]|nr:MAG: hypothetical protein COW05_04820 [Gammaproteobacteria bacterium CG12_big_fil_rev_8_21_14_0_65_46_12]PIR11232.1 MAG: hypothetical protein COV52_05055 [Gammaproteobacteria bacterium CG11_big_fil_rev_8_21_14_0_20_46_22]